MLERLPEISGDWASWLGTRLRLGIGVHTGGVQVGNAGSSQRPKYGPRGANVHVAHRIEAATKLISVPLILSESVAMRLSNRFPSYRLCRAELTGIHRPLGLYGVVAADSDAQSTADAAAYERALCHFEHAQFEQALFELSKIGAGTHVPVDFLREHIEHEQGGRERRRATDKPMRQTDGLIKLRVK